MAVDRRGVGRALREPERRSSAGSRWWSKLGFAPLAVVALVAGAAWSFFELGRYAGGERPSELDRSLLLAMRSATDPSDALGPPWFEELVRDVTGLGGLGVLTLVTAIVFGFLVLAGRARTAVLLAAWIVAGAFASFGLKELFDRPRPDVVPHLMRVSTASFPSGHALLSTVVYVTLGTMLAPVQTGRLKVYVIAVALVVAVLVGASRVYLGVHWPSDVLAGLAFGCGWAGAAWLVERHLQVTGTIEPEPEQEPGPGLREVAS